MFAAAKDFRFIAVKGAGHEVPTFKPAAAFDLFSAFLHGAHVLIDEFMTRSRLAHRAPVNDLAPFGRQVLVGLAEVLAAEEAAVCRQQ